MQAPSVELDIKLVFIIVLSLFFLTPTRSDAQVRVHTYLDGIIGADYTGGGLGIEIEKQLEVDYSISLGFGYREHVNWKNDEYYVNWGLLEIPAGFKYYIHPALAVQLLAAPRLVISSPSGFAMGSGHDVNVQTTPRFNTNIGFMVTTGGSFLGLFSLPKVMTIGAGLRYNLLPQSIHISDADYGEHTVKDHGVGLTLKAGITLFTLKRKKL